MDSRWELNGPPRSWQAARVMYAALGLAARLFPMFQAHDIEDATRRLLPASERCFVDRWLLPAASDFRGTRPPRRVGQVMRKFLLMDSHIRRADFAFYYGMETVRAKLTASK